VTGHRKADLAVSTASHAQLPVSQEHSESIAAVSGTLGPQSALTELAPQLLLVGDPERGAAAQRMLEASAAGQGQAGLTSAKDTVMVVGQQTSAADVLVACGFENEQRAASGLPPIQVEDLW
jgi:hypothetical protein